MSIEILIADMIESPSKQLLRTILSDYLEEHDNLDFKKDYSDFSKIAKHMLAMANSGGGIIIFGVEEIKKQREFIAIGLSESDVISKEDFDNKLEKFVPRTFKYNFYKIDLEIDDGKERTFDVLVIKENVREQPHISNLVEGNSINQSTIYVRRGTKSVKANQDDLRSLINNRLLLQSLNKTPNDFSNSVEKLKILYKHVPRKKTVPVLGFPDKLFSPFTQVKDSEHYPAETFEEFITKCVSMQKDIITSSLG